MMQSQQSLQVREEVSGLRSREQPVGVLLRRRGHSKLSATPKHPALPEATICHAGDCVHVLCSSTPVEMEMEMVMESLETFLRYMKCLFIIHKEMAWDNEDHGEDGRQRTTAEAGAA
jgi:hypothetical protein